MIKGDDLNMYASAFNFFRYQCDHLLKEYNSDFSKTNCSLFSLHWTTSYTGQWSVIKHVLICSKLLGYKLCPTLMYSENLILNCIVMVVVVCVCVRKRDRDRDRLRETQRYTRDSDFSLFLLQYPYHMILPEEARASDQEHILAYI